MRRERPGPDLWARSSSLDGQYRTDSNLSARQSIYGYERPRVDLPAAVFDLLGLRGDEDVADVGCGNGMYLAELARRGHRGRLLGLDLSRGMLWAARERSPAVGLAAGDAACLPLPDGAVDVTLAMHMLYHVPSPESALRELRRVTHPGGRVVITLNGEEHLREMFDIIRAALAELGAGDVPVREHLRLDHGMRLAEGVFASVTRHDFGSELLLPDTGPVADYMRSTIIAQQAADPEALVDAVVGRIPFGRDGVFRVRTRSGCLICS